MTAQRRRVVAMGAGAALGITSGCGAPHAIPRARQAAPTATPVALKALVRGQPNHPIAVRWPGLTVTGEVDPALAASRGQPAVFGAVVQPWRDGRAALAGVHPGDVVVAVNGEDTPSWRAFVAAMAHTPEGEPAELRIARAGSDPAQPDEVVVTVGWDTPKPLEPGPVGAAPLPPPAP